MSKVKTTIVIILMIIGIIWFAQLVGAQTPSDKSDGECTGRERAGRCADKCPEGTTLQGYKDDTSAAICKINPTGCPYGDSIPLGPQCDKHKQDEQKTEVLGTSTPLEPFQGK